MAYNPNPRLVSAIRSMGGELAPLLLATTLVESGGRLDAVGDGGMSIGPYQMHSRGRGYGVPPAKRMDPVFSTESALAEFRRFASRGLSGAELAFSAQRPADRAGYIRKINAALPEATRILGGKATPIPNAEAEEPPGGRLPPIGGPPASSGRDDAAGAQRTLALSAVQAINEIGSPEGMQPSTLLGLASARSNAEAAREAIKQERTRRRTQPGPGAPAPANAPTAPGEDPASLAPAPGGGGILKGAIFGSPVPGQQPHAASHPTSGLSGYPAFDYMAAAGTRVAAPVGGRIFKLSGRDPSAGGPSGGPLGYSIYLQGTNGKRYFLTHLDNPAVRVNQNVRQGEQIAVVAAGPSSWSSPHVHMGVSG